MFLFRCLFTYQAPGAVTEKEYTCIRPHSVLSLAPANIFRLRKRDDYAFSVRCAICLIAYDRFTPRRCLIFVLSVAAVGLAANNRGLIGLIPVVTTAIYTVGCLYARSPRAIKLNLILNLILWAICDLIILDRLLYGRYDLRRYRGLALLFRGTAECKKQGNATFK